MDKIVKFESAENIEIEASEWVARLDCGLGEAETERLRAWLALSSRHRSTLMRFTSLWDRMDSMARLSSLFPNVGGVGDEVTVVDERDHNKVNPRFPQKALAYAASFLITVLSVGWLVAVTDPTVLNPTVASLYGVPHEENGLFETGLGEHSTIILADGSELTLNTNTLVKVKYEENSRLFFLLRGEIHIDVAHDKARPLSVMSGDKVVQAIGTAFNVQRDGDSAMELIVTDGKVLVADREGGIKFEDYIPPTLTLEAEKSVAISKGEKIVFGAGDATATVDVLNTSDMEASLSWRQGNLVFRGETLEEALTEISRYTDVEFIIRDESIKNVRIAGVFKAGDVTGLLETLKRNFDIEADRLGRSTVRLNST